MSLSILLKFMLKPLLFIRLFRLFLPCGVCETWRYYSSGAQRVSCTGIWKKKLEDFLDLSELTILTESECRSFYL